MTLSSAHIRIWFLIFSLYLGASNRYLFAQDVNLGFHFTNSFRKSVRIPVEIQHNLILLPIKINNLIEVNFILDTGSRTTVITEPMLLNVIGVNNRGRDIRIQGLGQGDAIIARLIDGIRLNLPEVEGTDIEMVVLPPDLISFSEVFGKPVFGIIGYELFSKFVVEINYQQKYIQLYNPKHHQYKGRGEVVKAELKNGKPYINAVVSDEKGDTTHLNLLIDTGATQALTIFEQRIRVPKNNIDTYLGRGLSGDIMGKMGRLQSLNFGNFVLPNPVVGFPNEQSLQVAMEQGNWDGNLGGDVLSRFIVTLNYLESEIYFRPNAHFSLPFLYDLSGIQLEARGYNYQNIIVSYVRPASAAEQAGITVGDEIISVNGTSASNATIGELYDILNKKPGRKIKLKIKKEGKISRKVFVLTQPI